MSTFRIRLLSHLFMAAAALPVVLTHTPMLTNAQDTVGKTRVIESPLSDTAWRVVGYVPDYRLEGFDESSATFVTDLVVFSAEAEANGTLNTQRFSAVQLRRLKQIKQRTRVGLILCVGGWERSKGFAGMSASADARQRFVSGATRFCLDQRFDGIDLDWEHPANEGEQKNYAILLKDLKSVFQEHGLSVSVTMAAWQQIPAEVFATVDSIQVMAYDHNGRHSTLEGAERDIKSLLDRGAPASKLILGLPFYGRDLKNPDRTLTYAEIVKKFTPAADMDEVDGVYFNGPRTIERKVRFAQGSKLAGVMIWELGQDAPAEKSLLRVIRRSDK